MSIELRVLGSPGRDNALLVNVDTGSSMERLLFDCGDGCLNELSFGEIQAIDQLFFSHLHMDHIGGFDTFIRCNYARGNRLNAIWGPAKTSHILQHRFQGFLWNLHEEMKGTWHLFDVQSQEVHRTRLELAEAFESRHDEGARRYSNGVIYESEAYTVEALVMDHKTPSLAYIVRERSRKNIDTRRLEGLGIKPGPWIQKIKKSEPGELTIAIEGTVHNLEDLRRELVVESPGSSVAYLTDFRLDEAAMDCLTDALQGCQVVVCEAQYSHEDLALAEKHYHMTVRLVAELAQRARVDELVLFHLSDRYDQEAWHGMLAEARAIFPATRFPEHWFLDA